MPLYSFDARKSYLNGYYQANFVLPGTSPIGPRLGSMARQRRLAFDPRARYLSGLGDDPSTYDPGDVLTPPSFPDPVQPLILVPSSAGDPSAYSAPSTLTAPSIGSPAQVISAVGSTAAQIAAANNPILNPAGLKAPFLTQQSIPGVPNSYLMLAAGAFLLVSLAKSPGKRR